MIYTANPDETGETVLLWTIANAIGANPYGTEYPVCTTIQYDLRPASNSTTLIVGPQSTDTLTSTKTPEEMQADAEDEGWLSVWHEFTWQYPWYRIHIQINVNPRIHVAFNPILPGGEIADWSGLEFFAALVEELVTEVFIQAIGLIATYIVARYIPLPLAPTAILIEVGKNILQGLLFLGDWENALRLLACGLVSLTMMFFALVNFYTSPNLFLKFVNALWTIVGHGVQGALRWVMVALTEMAMFGKLAGNKIIDGIEILADFTIALVAFIRYIDLTT